MARPYGGLPDEEIRARMTERQREIDANAVEQNRVDAEPHAEVDLAHSRRALVLAREGAALSKDMTELYVELHLRNEGIIRRDP